VGGFCLDAVSEDGGRNKGPESEVGGGKFAGRGCSRIRRTYSFFALRRQVGGKKCDQPGSGTVRNQCRVI